MKKYITDINYINAMYGINNKMIDVSNKIKNNDIIKVCNIFFEKDPCIGKTKTLVLKYNNYVVSIPENEIFYIKMLIYPHKHITKRNIDWCISTFKQYTSAIIFGKGPTFASIKRDDNSILYVGINQAANEMPECDMLVINDILNIYKIKDSVLMQLKYILLPEYMHINNEYNKEGYYMKVHNYIKDKFTGMIIIYNLKTTQKYNYNIIDLPSCISSSNTSNDFICMFLPINNIKFYGVGISSTMNYNSLFTGNGLYNDDNISIIRNNIIETCNKYNKNYELL